MATANQLIANLEGINAESFANEVERMRARDAVLEALRRIQSPWDITWDHNWVNLAIHAAIKTLIDAGVFNKWAEAGGEPITSTKLAELAGAEEQLIRRMMRTLAGQHLITETAEDTYARTPWAAALASDPPLAGTYGGLYKDLHAPLFQSLPGYLKSTGFRVPADVNDCNMQFCYGKDSNLFHYVGSNPALAASFNDAMECHSKYNLTPWVDLYPTESILADAAEKEGGDSRPLVVDIGGSKGHDLKKFLARHPEVPAGSLVLEDLPDILNGVEESLGSEQKAITVQPHDFFKPQPAATCGAKVYFMHNVLHDWPDETARRIVETLAPAMEKGYSRLLIHESLVTNVRPLSRITVSDITMMACVAAAERTEEDWKNLIESAGLRLVKIWRPEHSAEGVLEVEVA